MKHLNWGIIGASNFARKEMAPAIHAAEGVRLHGLATSSHDKAAGFRAFAPDLALYDSYAALLDDPAIDAVYIPLPNHLHVEWTLKALAAGKHVLCEKPMALQADQFDDLVMARDAAGRLAAEAFMIVHHPQFVRARELVQSGAIGELVHVESVFSYFNADTANIRNRSDAAGGALRDIGVYVMGAARFVTGVEPLAVTQANIRFENGVDVFAQFAATFPAFTYNAMVTMRAAPRQGIIFHGETGVLTLHCPFNANVYDLAAMTLDTAKNARLTERWPQTNHYVLQVENFGRAVMGEADYPCPLEFSRGTQAMMDMVFAAGEDDGH